MNDDLVFTTLDYACRDCASLGRSQCRAPGHMRTFARQKGERRPLTAVSS
jgi:hypothetical protein